MFRVKKVRFWGSVWVRLQCLATMTKWHCSLKNQTLDAFGGYHGRVALSWGSSELLLTRDFNHFSHSSFPILLPFLSQIDPLRLDRYLANFQRFFPWNSSIPSLYRFVITTLTAKSRCSYPFLEIYMFWGFCSNLVVSSTYYFANLHTSCKCFNYNFLVFYFLDIWVWMILEKLGQN